MWGSIPSPAQTETYAMDSGTAAARPRFRFQMDKPHRHILTAIGTWLARPEANLLVVAYAVAWVIFEPETLDWHGAVTLLTLLMTLFILRVDHRDTQAIHAKLDELLRVHAQASNDIADLDEEEPETIERVRDAQHDGAAQRGA